jgi:hypothetical protein
LRGAVAFLKIPGQRLAELEGLYNAHKADPTQPVPRLVIAKHHFPIDLVSMNLPWLSPLTKEAIDGLDCYKNRSPPPNQDAFLSYDPKLGRGQSGQSKKDNSGRKLFRVAPFCTMKEVVDIAAAVQNGTSGTTTTRIYLDAIRQAHILKEIQYQ